MSYSTTNTTSFLPAENLQFAVSANTTFASTVAPPPPTPLASILLYIVYMFLGFVGVSGNMLVFVAIGRVRKLQERYVLQWLLSSGDVMNSLGYFLAGALRLRYAALGLLGLQRAQTGCFEALFPVLMVIGNELTAFTETFICIDRFVAICFPSAYFKIADKRRLGIIACCLAYAIGVVAVLATLIFTVTGPPATTSYWCPVPNSLGNNIEEWDTAIVPVGTACISTVFVVTTIIVMRKRGKNLAEGSDAAARDYKRQVRFTKVMLAVYVSMVIYQGASFMLILLVNLDVQGMAAVVLFPIAGCLLLVHSVVNPIIYGCMSEEIRSALLATLNLFTGRVCGRIGSGRVGQGEPTDQSTTKAKLGVGETGTTARKQPANVTVTLADMAQKS